MSWWWAVNLDFSEEANKSVLSTAVIKDIIEEKALHLFTKLSNIKGKDKDKKIVLSTQGTHTPNRNNKTRTHTPLVAPASTGWMKPVFSLALGPLHAPLLTGRLEVTNCCVLRMIISRAWRPVLLKATRPEPNFLGVPGHLTWLQSFLRNFSETFRKPAFFLYERSCICCCGDVLFISSIVQKEGRIV